MRALVLLALIIAACASDEGPRFAADYGTQLDAFRSDFDSAGKAFVLAATRGDASGEVSALNDAIGAVDRLRGWQRTARVPRSNSEVAAKVDCEFASTPRLGDSLAAMRSALVRGDAPAFNAANRDLRDAIAVLDRCGPSSSTTVRTAMASLPPLPTPTQKVVIETLAPSVRPTIPPDRYVVVATDLPIPQNLPLPGLLAQIRERAPAAFTKARSMAAATGGEPRLIDWDVFYVQQNVVPDAARAGIDWTFEVLGGVQGFHMVVGFQPNDVELWPGSSSRLGKPTVAAAPWADERMYQLLALMAREHLLSTITAKRSDDGDFSVDSYFMSVLPSSVIPPGTEAVFIASGDRFARLRPAP